MITSTEAAAPAAEPHNHEDNNKINTADLLSQKRAFRRMREEVARRRQNIANKRLRERKKEEQEKRRKEEEEKRRTEAEAIEKDCNEWQRIMLHTHRHCWGPQQELLALPRVGGSSLCSGSNHFGDRVLILRLADNNDNNNDNDNDNNSGCFNGDSDNDNDNNSTIRNEEPVGPIDLAGYFRRWKLEKQEEKKKLRMRQQRRLRCWVLGKPDLDGTRYNIVFDNNVVNNNNNNDSLSYIVLQQHEKEHRRLREFLRRLDDPKFTLEWLREQQQRQQPEEIVEKQFNNTHTTLRLKRRKKFDNKIATLNWVREQQQQQQEQQ